MNQKMSGDNAASTASAREYATMPSIVVGIDPHQSPHLFHRRRAMGFSSNSGRPVFFTAIYVSQWSATSAIQIQITMDISVTNETGIVLPPMHLCLRIRTEHHHINVRRQSNGFNAKNRSGTTWFRPRCGGMLGTENCQVLYQCSR